MLAFSALKIHNMICFKEKIYIVSFSSFSLSIVVAFAVVSVTGAHTCLSVMLTHFQLWGCPGSIVRVWCLYFSRSIHWGLPSFAAVLSHSALLGWELSCQLIPYPQSPKAEPETFQSLFLSCLQMPAWIYNKRGIRVRPLTLSTLPSLAGRCGHAIKDSALHCRGILLGHYLSK